MAISRLYDFAPDTTAQSGQVDDEFNQLVAEVNFIEANFLQIAQAIPAGTKAVFYQAVAPTGWTRDTSFNDKFVRIVSAGSPGTTGGAFGLGSEAAHTHTLVHTHDMGNHTHSDGSYHTTMTVSGGAGDDIAVREDSSGSWTSEFNYALNRGTESNAYSNAVGVDGTSGTPSTNTTGAASTSTTSAGSSHTHTHTSAEHAYADVLLATKNAY